ncbi:DUF6252 family protein [Flagellimonas algicola]|uniref:Lipoprotein n=1 Tax=Flagellimonas algicola TaxID=2583815 RepID=A0ABY2WGA0_9FLAO|nr:DUF6252 family protein [Allomuricauda algicola]TMU50427.1 hypothetical protein FGG15_19585 [Allomuricauda algicola]
MKTLLAFMLMVILTACNNDDDGTPENPADALPPATQTGEGTFGCLIDGEPFFPGRFGGDQPSAFYQFVRDAYTLGISASRGGGETMVGFNLGALDIEGLEEKTYSLTTFESGNFFAEYLIGGGIELTSSPTDEEPGILTITNFTDEIISGTFEFTVLDNEGNEIRITDGRFDLRYTN